MLHPPVPCSSGFQYDTKTCYIPSDVETTWVDARSSCEALASPSSSLAHIKDVGKQTFLEERLADNATGDVWIGVVEGKTWTWDGSEC